MVWVKMRSAMKSACSCERGDPDAQLPMNVESSTGIWRAPFRSTLNPLRDCMSTKDVGDTELSASHPGARTTYAVLSEAATVLCASEEPPGGMGFWNATACQYARYTTSGVADGG